MYIYKVKEKIKEKV